MDGDSSLFEGVQRGEVTLSQEQDCALITFDGDIASLLCDGHFQRIVLESARKPGRVLNSRFVAEAVSQYAVFYVLGKLANSDFDSFLIRSVVSEMVQNVVTHGSHGLFDCPGARIDCVDDGLFIVITATQQLLEKDKFEQLKHHVAGLQVHSAVADRIASSQAGEPFQVGGMGLFLLKGLIEGRGGTLTLSQDDTGLHFCARFPRV